MAVLPWLVFLALLAAAMPARACGGAAWQPAPVRLAGDGPVPSAMLLAPAGWEAGDPAVVLEGEAFRTGCDDPQAAALLEAGMMVLALAPADPAAEGERLVAGILVLRRGFGAGGIAVLLAPGRLAGEQAACGAVLAGLSRPEAAAGACRPLPR